MNRFLFALTMGCVFAASIDAQQPAPATAAPAPAAVPAPVVIGGAGVTPSVMAPNYSAPARRGLFGRLRSRGMTAPITATSSYTGGVITTPSTVSPPPAQMPTVTPSPMPRGTSAAPGVTGQPVVVAGATMVDGTGTPVVVAGGVVPANGAVMPAAAMTTSTMTTAQVVNTAPRRMGLIARLRARR